MKDVVTFQKIIKYIKNLKISAAIEALRKRDDFKTNTSLVNRTNEIEQMWRGLLSVQAKGFSDSTLHRNIGKIQEELFSISDCLRREIYIKNSSSQYAADARLEKLQNISILDRLNDCNAKFEIAQLALAGDNVNYDVFKEADDSLSNLFSCIFTLYMPSKEIVRSIEDVMTDDVCSLEMRLQIITALTLGLLHFYDVERFKLLIDIALNSNSPKIQARSLIGVLLVLRKYSARIQSDMDIIDRLSAMKDSSELYSLLRSSVLGIVSTYDTKRISEKLENEIIPQMMKLRPDLMKKLREIDPENPEASLDFNPEWDDILNKSGMTDKLMELGNLQESGADIMMVPFSKLKHFPFFNRLSNWTLPYSRYNSYLIRNVNTEALSLLDVLSQAEMICDNDKYSLALSLTQIPSSQFSLIKNQMEAQKEMLKAESSSKALRSSVPEFDSEVLNYVRDLYRLFKLSRFKDDSQDVFSRPFNISNLPVIAEILSKEEIYKLLIEFYFQRGFYEESLPMIERLIKNNNTDSSLLEKAGFCYQMLGDFISAIRCYERAYDLKPESLWTIKKLAYCYKVVGNNLKSAQFYAEIGRREPDNIKVALNEANAHRRLGEYDAAANLYYKVSYLDSNNISALKGLAELEMLRGNFDKSSEYMLQLLLMSPTPELMVKAGNLALLKHDMAEAIRLYGDAFDEKIAECNDKDIALKFISDNINVDKDLLIANNVDTTLLSLVSEILYYK